MTLKPVAEPLIWFVADVLGGDFKQFEFQTAVLAFTVLHALRPQAP